MVSPEKSYELIIVGSGPAGLSAAVNASSEGLQTLVIDGSDHLGGQAATSTLIENYAGSPSVTGEELTFRMVDQAHSFGTDFQAPLQVERIEPGEDGIIVRDDSAAYLGEAVLISCGVRYRRPAVPNMAIYLGRGVHYGSPNKAAKYSGQNLFVVGGANSAGQAALHLSKYSDCDVHMLVRGRSIEDKMSAYLATRIHEAPNIEVHTQTEISKVSGDGKLEKLSLVTDGEEQEVDADRLFLLIGAVPRTTWLPDGIAKDDHGFVVAGGDLPEEVRNKFAAECGRQPFSQETSIRGVFVAGDVRSGSIKRVASAAGDGAAVVPDLHRYLAGE